MNFQNTVVISHTDIFKTQEEALCNNDTNLMLKTITNTSLLKGKALKPRKLRELQGLR